MKKHGNIAKTAFLVLLSSSLAYAAPEKKELKIGFIALTDCAPIVIAKEKGFFEKYGLNVQIIKEGAGWAGIQQKVISGEYDAAHALAGMPLASTIGINGETPMVALMSLDFNGNAITMSNKIIELMEKEGLDPKQRPVNAQTLKKVIDKKKTKEGGSYKPYEFGMVYPVSTHNYQIRYWMAASGIDPDTDVTLKVFPPPQMVSNMQAGNIDGYSVGEPWNERAVMAKIGSALMTSYDIWNNNPEKVLQVTEAFANQYPETSAAMIKAMIEASRWLDDSWENRKEAVKILAKKEYVNAPEDVLEKSMTGTFQYLKDHVSEENPMFNVFSHNFASYPYRSHGMWFVTQMYRWGQIDKAINIKEVVERVYRSDLFEKAAKEVAYNLPPSSYKIEGIDQYNKFIDGKVFDPNKAVEYIYSFDVKHPKVSQEALLKVNSWNVRTAQPEYVCTSGLPGCAK